MLNRVILIGRAATDPEPKFTPSGIAVTTFRIAVDRPLSAEARAQGQEKQADFIDIVTWRQTAEFVANYLTKGRLIAVEGRLQIREYVTQDGQRRKSAEVVADNLRLLDRPRDAEGGEGGGEAPARGGYAEPSRSGGGGYDRGGDARGGDARGGDTRGGEARGGPARGAGGGNVPARGAAPRGGTPPADNYDDELSDLSDPFAE
jgi:single-strand DNA-binding protein